MGKSKQFPNNFCPINAALRTQNTDHAISYAPLIGESEIKKF